MTTNNHNDVIEQIDVYALGALEPAEAAVVADHIAVCPQCAAAYEASQRVINVLLWAPEEHQPPADLLERIKSRIQEPVHEQPPVVPLRRRRWWGNVAAPAGGSAWIRSRLMTGIAGAVLVVALVISTVRYERHIGVLQHELQQQKEVVDVLRLPGTRLIALQAAENGTGTAEMVVDGQGTHAFLLTSDLPTLSMQQTYEFWLIGAQGAERAGLFRVDGHGRALLQITSKLVPKDAKAAGITIEPAGGSVQPTTKPVLLGQL
ncbi:MAG: anti-sigma factor [Herpetosiphon sp.]